MTTERKVNIALSTVILAGLVLFGYQTVKAHIANVVAETQAQDDEAASLKLANAIRDRDAAQDKYAKAVLAVPVKTAAQAVQVINRYVPVETEPTKPGLPVEPTRPSMVEIDAGHVTEEDRAKLPDSASYVLSTADSGIQVAKQLQQCDITTHALAACRSDLTDSESQTAIAERNAQTWENAAKGGSKWSRVWTATKWSLAGAGVGLAVGYAAHH